MPYTFELIVFFCSCGVGRAGSFRMALCVGCLSGTVLCSLYHVNAQGVDERMVNVHYYHY